MNRYEARIEERRARLEERAEKASQLSQATYSQARDMASVIPFGQPILVGHHSERRDRNYRNRIHKTYGRAFEQQEKAEYYERKAASVGTGGISSDDPDAIDKLRDKLTKAKDAQEKMKAANRLVRKQDRAGLVDLGFTEAQVDELMKPDFCGRVGFPSYALNNNRGEIRRIEQRIRELETLAERSDVEEVTRAYTYREDVEENRVMFLFGCKPDAETRRILKARGFRWSPKREGQPWCRKLNNAGLYAAQQVRKELDAE